MLPDLFSMTGTVHQVTSAMNGLGLMPVLLAPGDDVSEGYPLFGLKPTPLWADLQQWNLLPNIGVFSSMVFIFNRNVQSLTLTIGGSGESSRPAVLMPITQQNPLPATQIWQAVPVSLGPNSKCVIGSPTLGFGLTMGNSSSGLAPVTFTPLNMTDPQPNQLWLISGYPS